MLVLLGSITGEAAKLRSSKCSQSPKELLQAGQMRKTEEMLSARCSAGESVAHVQFQQGAHAERKTFVQLEVR
jgi:hypothetical protein